MWPLHAIIAAISLCQPVFLQIEIGYQHNTNVWQAACRLVNIGFGQGTSSLTGNHPLSFRGDLDHSSHEKFREGECPKKSTACKLIRMKKKKRHFQEHNLPATSQLATPLTLTPPHKQLRAAWKRASKAAKKQDVLPWKNIFWCLGLESCYLLMDPFYGLRCWLHCSSKQTRMNRNSREVLATGGQNIKYILQLQCPLQLKKPTQT